MMSIKKMVATNKMCTYMALTVLGAAVGMAAAKMVVTHCCCAEKLKHKAKKAFRAMEEKILD